MSEPKIAPGKRVLIVAATTGYQTRSFAEAADRLGLVPLLATDRCHVLDDPWGDGAVPLRFEDSDGAAAALAAVTPAPHGIVAVGDRPAYIAALAAPRLGLRFSPPDAVAACRDKFLLRQRLAACGLPVPAFRRLPLDADLEAAAAGQAYPCVLKPLGLSASRGVIRANDASEFHEAFRRVAALLDTPDIRRLRDPQDDFLQVESYIPGQEFAIEALVTAGRARVVVIFDKPDPLEGPFFEETIYVTPSRTSHHVQRALTHALEQTVAALGLSDGPVHAEMRVNGLECYVLDVAARPIGGLCSRAVQLESGATLEELILRHACGEDVSTVRTSPAASGVMMIPIPRSGVYRGVSGEEAARGVPLIDDVVITAKAGQHLRQLPEGASYLGFVFASGPTPSEVETALRLAHACLRFDIAQELLQNRRG